MSITHTRNDWCKKWLDWIDRLLEWRLQWLVVVYKYGKRKEQKIECLQAEIKNNHEEMVPTTKERLPFKNRWRTIIEKRGTEACPGKREVYLKREENPKETARRQMTRGAVPAMRKERICKRRGRDSFARGALKWRMLGKWRLAKPECITASGTVTSRSSYFWRWRGHPAGTSRKAQKWRLQSE